MKSLWVKAENCIGCSQCVLACSFAKKSYFSPLDALLALIQWEERGFTQTVVCTQCEEAPCEQACPSMAIKLDQATGAYIVINEFCLSCGLCVDACPIGMVFIDRQTGMSVKCDLCGGKPACVEVCHWDALVFEEHDWNERKAFRDELEAIRAFASKDEEPVFINNPRKDWLR